MVYDALNDRLVLFGGFDFGLYADTWELPLSGTPNWAPLSTAGTVPSPRAGGRATYDAVRQRMVIYGGYGGGVYPREVDALSLDATPTWSIIEDGTGYLRPRRDYASAYSPAGHQIYMYGGTGNSGDNDELWRLPLTAPYDWKRVDVGALTPGKRHGHRSVWDPVRGRMLVFGGYVDAPGPDYYANDVWAFVPTPTPHWEPIATTGALPLGRMLSGLAYDPIGDRLIVIGGHAGDPVPYLSDVYQLPLSGGSAHMWSPLAPTGTPPAPRWIYGASYDPPRHRIVFYGGVTATGRVNDTWALTLGGTPTWTRDPGRWKQPRRAQ